MILILMLVVLWFYFLFVLHDLYQLFNLSILSCLFCSKKPPPAPSSGTPTTGVSKKQQEKDTADKDKLKNQIANFKNDSLHPSHSAPVTIC